jgi:hypothetical protein
MGTGPSRLFHAIVVIGASIGCGGGRLAAEGVDASDGSPGPADADAALEEDHAAPAVPEASVTRICDCQRPGTFRCSACASGSAPIEGRCPDNDGVRCFCDDSIKIAAPTDCEHPEQFACQYLPDSDAAIEGFGFGVNDWFAFANCTCDPTRPLSASQCTCDCRLQCAEAWDCTYDGIGQPKGPSYACECLPATVTIK